jgi:hypothetical protein
MKLNYSSRYKLSLAYYTKFYYTININLKHSFKIEVKNSLKSISQNPIFENRYDIYRCLPLNKFPFMIHFVVEVNRILILDIIHTSRNPDEHWIK